MAHTKKMDTKGYAYLRVSTRGQVAKDGFPRQRKAIKEYAKQHDIRIVQEFQEKGVSGKKDLEHRPAFADMMTMLLANGVDIVIIEKLDRLARDLLVQETIVADLQRRGVTLVSTMEPDLCSSDPTRTLIRQVFGVIAQYERSMITLRLKAARQRVREKTGRCEGQKPYGSYPGEKSTINLMQRLHSEGQSLSAIANRLNDTEIPPRSGKQWYPMTVRNILQRK